MHVQLMYGILLQRDLRYCISKKVPVLLAQGKVRFIIIDSIAALFRCEFEVHETVRRARELSSFASQLHQLSYKYSCPVVCVNQVSIILCTGQSYDCNCRSKEPETLYSPMTRDVCQPYGNYMCKFTLHCL